jgi:hypothetical protein
MVADCKLSGKGLNYFLVSNQESSLSFLRLIFMGILPQIERALSDPPIRKNGNGARKARIDSKVQGLVIPKITVSQAGSLLAALGAPFLVLPQKRRREGTRSRSSRFYPIGLLSYSHPPWLNALMQLIVGLPFLRNLFLLAPKCYRPFNDFIDQYLSDMEEGRRVCSVDGRELAGCLYRYVPFVFSLSVAEGFEHIRRFAGGGGERSMLGKEGRSLFFCDEGRGFELAALIEKRPEPGGGVSYYTYLKMEGRWVQCDDERIIPVRSTLLPLKRGDLFYYRELLYSPLSLNLPN